MARQLRIEYPGAFYHVMNRGAARKKIFHGEEFSSSFLNLLSDLNHNFGVQIYAYCLMGNHYHLLIQTPHANLSKAMRHLNGVYTLRYNRLMKQDGPLFRGRFKAMLIDADDYLLQVSRYIHLNPVEANLAKKPENYFWSSYQFYCKKSDKPDWLNLDEILSYFNGRNKNLDYQSFISEGIDSQMAKIYRNLSMPAILGKELFQTKIKANLNINIHKEIPATKKLPHQFLTKEKVVQKIAQYKKCNPIDITMGNDKTLKKIAIYFCKKLTNAPLGEIGDYFSGISYSAVSQVCKRIINEMNENETFASDVNKIEAILSNVKT